MKILCPNHDSKYCLCSDDKKPYGAPRGCVEIPAEDVVDDRHVAVDTATVAVMAAILISGRSDNGDFPPKQFAVDTAIDVLNLSRQAVRERGAV